MPAMPEEIEGRDFADGPRKLPLLAAHASGTVVATTKSTDTNIPSATAAARAHEGVAALAPRKRRRCASPRGRREPTRVSPTEALGMLMTPVPLTPLATLVQLLLPVINWLDI